MPFNINPSCPAGQKTVINWQFPGQAAKTNDQGDDYKVYQKPGQCLGVSYTITYNFIEIAGKTIIGPRTRSISSSGRRVVSGDTGNYTINSFYYPGSPTQDPYYTHVETLQLFANGTLRYAPTTLTTNPYSGAVPGSISHTITRSDGLPDNCGNWVINIYKNGIVIESNEGGLQQPVVSHQCITPNQCPPGTCDVICANTICCYGADGVSVFSYPNT
jgi:hypothetical protein